MSSPQTPTFRYLEADVPPVFAAFHAAAGQSRARAVLLCPPFGWEDMCSYRSRRDWAEHLARAGFPALRVDLPGSGDSAGGPADAGQLNAWTRALSSAARWLADTSGAEHIVAVGIGLGGMVACRAALDGAPIEELVLWHVPARGNALVRELRAFSALEVAYIPDPDRGAAGEQPERLEDGALVANGYLMSAQTVAELQQLDLEQLASSSQGPRRALLLGRDGLKVDERLQGALERSGSAVVVADGPEYAGMTVEPQEARPPLRVFELVDSWLLAGERAPHGDAADSEHPLEGAGHHADRQRARPSVAISAHEELELTSAGVELRERPLTVHTPDGPLFGILTEPLGERRELSALLINAGAQRRTGPNRMWVEIARRWAARGVPTLRFDLAGIGDSDGDTASLAHVSTIYAQTYGRQARAALDTLHACGLPQRALVLGLCAGGYWSLHTALADERVGTVVMLNPRSLIWDEGIYAVRRVRELSGRLVLASTWRKALRGELNLARHLETAHALASRAARSSRRAQDRRDSTEREAVDRTTALAGIFDTLRDRGQLALLLFTGAEPLRRELAARGLLECAERWPNLEIAIRGTSADTHTLTPLWLQREVHELVDGALERELSRTHKAEERIA
jgi:alpha-beta hydrolase superfamily lysophospholipase